ncbi:alpha-amylase family glycosyl hydrolase [Puniceicoccaceae bacterium K14]|nr:alpha-amylase family glycosyl hydrolase [Puniceicoccaceae bacterium K14]
MPTEDPKSNSIKRAYFTSVRSGIIELAKDWRAVRLPPVRMEGKPLSAMRFKKMLPSEFARESRYYVGYDGKAVFVLDPANHEHIDCTEKDVYLVGSFNGWQKAVGDEAWKLSRSTLDGRSVFMLKVDLEALGGDEVSYFKFVTGDGVWFPVSSSSMTAVSDGNGSWNYTFNRKQTGRHRFEFEVIEPIKLSEKYHLLYHCRYQEESQRACIKLGSFFYQLGTDKPLGAIVSQNKTVFRLFAPRAKWVKVGILHDIDNQESVEWILMNHCKDHSWEVKIDRNLAGAYYWFRLDGPNDEFGMFDPSINVLDPYAKACVSRVGPAIVVDESQVQAKKVPLTKNIWWHDLVVLEAHTRDLVANTKFATPEGKPNGFKQLAEYARSDSFYPSKLGVNALELQPIQENDSQSYEEYHWGYMTANFFSPASSYASDPKHGSQIEEFRDLVSAIHEQEMVVILDVVYNHVGEPAHLMRIDKMYYFNLNAEGHLMNWSGCGNDLNCDTRMSRRLLVDSLKHLVEFYGVDGFRFDLADLVGKDALVEVEKELQAIKPDIILIAEPWSFRGHIGKDLRDTSYSSWNDGYREALKKYVRGDYGHDGITYFLKGSPDHYATWPAQTINYVESHDDRVWIDNITERANYDGSNPAHNDIRRTHMMISMLMMSIGMPMLHAGMDFLGSKQGVNNTYQDGPRNALNYSRQGAYPNTSEYFRAWIELRLSDVGKLVRLYENPGEGYFEFIYAHHRHAFACVYNASGELGEQRLLFAANPEEMPLNLEIGKWADFDWTQVADHERVWGIKGSPYSVEVDKGIYLPPLACGLWLTNL